MGLDVGTRVFNSQMAWTWLHTTMTNIPIMLSFHARRHVARIVTSFGLMMARVFNSVQIVIDVARRVPQLRFCRPIAIFYRRTDVGTIPTTKNQI